MVAVSLLQFLLVCAGFVSLVLLPTHLVQNVYVDENALMPRGAAATLACDHAFVRTTAALQHQLEVARADGASASRAAELLVQMLAALDLRATFVAGMVLAARQCSADSDDSGTDKHIVVASVLRAPRGDGKESIVLVAEWWPSSTLHGDDAGQWPAAASYLISLQRHLQTATWLSKDIIVVVLIPSVRIDSRRRLATVHSKSPACRALAQRVLWRWFESTQSLNATRGVRGVVPRLGIVSVALVLDAMSGTAFDRLNLNPVGEFGLLPNMDALSSLIESSRASALPIAFMQPSIAIGDTSSTAESEQLLQQQQYPSPSLLASLHSLRAHVIAAASSSAITSSLLKASRKWATTQRTFLNHAAAAITGGSAELHSVFLSNSIDSFTVQMSQLRPTSAQAADSSVNVRAVGCLLESYVRIHSNLIEKLHHSLHLYALVSSKTFSSISKYAVCFLLFLAPLGLHVLYLYFSEVHTSRGVTVPRAVLLTSLAVCAFNVLGAAALALVPGYALLLSGETRIVEIWVVLVSVCSLLPHVASWATGVCIEWSLVKAVTLCGVCVASGALFILNFFLAMVVVVLVSVLLLPACTLTA